MVRRAVPALLGRHTGRNSIGNTRTASTTLVLMMCCGMLVSWFTVQIASQNLTILSGSRAVLVGSLSLSAMQAMRFTLMRT
ncbi:hypothetical protein RRG08_008840 [Elysia crispata]|uniref:Uncharacterized protein n=1 Tax=Elysia crispata TaxID=231223 RepID=A0AAE1A8X0_9GAST|nr:hypothetical protein RRG08_008840 [Elysia crispata]